MKRHGFDPVSFVFGLLFVSVAVFVLAGNSLTAVSPLWLVTVPAGVTGLLVVLYGVKRVVSTRTRDGSGDDRSDI